MTTSRRSFFKTLVGAFVASAIELNLTVKPRVGEMESILHALTEMTREVWIARYREAFNRMVV